MTTNAEAVPSDGTAFDDAAADEEIIDICRRRADLYGMLSRLYRREVDEKCLQGLKEMRLPARTGNEAADEGYRLIAKYLGVAHANCLNDLALDYAKTFIGEGMSSFSAAYPYESVHTSEKRLLMQDARDEVLAAMRTEGLETDKNFHETEDHISAEFEFMQVLAARAADALKSGDDDEALRLLHTQADFLDNHIAAWVPLFTREVRKFAATDFYKGLSYLTDGFICAEQEFLGDID